METCDQCGKEFPEGSLTLCSCGVLVCQTCYYNHDHYEHDDKEE